MHARKRKTASKRRFIAKGTPLPTVVADDASIPAFGQRKLSKKRRPTLHPLPVKGD